MPLCLEQHVWVLSSASNPRRSVSNLGTWSRPTDLTCLLYDVLINPLLNKISDLTGDTRPSKLFATKTAISSFDFQLDIPQQYPKWMQARYQWKNLTPGQIPGYRCSRAAQTWRERPTLLPKICVSPRFTLISRMKWKTLNCWCGVVHNTWSHFRAS